jgi:deoxycytidine triphosphate deaminase
LPEIDAEFVDPATYWKQDEGWVPPRAYWEDPHPDFEGMLSSDLILEYNKVLGGKMIEPLCLANLKPAAYELTLGPLYYVDGDRRVLDENDPWLTLPRNSIVFVSMQERLAIPHYIAARFDLAIEFIYQGILLGTGPQVDPGFQGVLSCPLHNISDGDVSLRYGYPFAKIDFAKTSGLRFGPEHGRGGRTLVPRKLDVADEGELYRRVESGDLVGVGGERIKLLNRANRWREPIFSNDYTGRRQIVSSLRGLEREIADFGGAIDAFDEEIARLRRFGLAGGLAVVFAMIAIVITLAQLDRSYTDAKVTSVQVPPGQGAQMLAKLRGEISSLEVRLDQLEKKITSRKR